ncbi:MAG: LysM peptidoglycan-binding domain-containing protein [Caldilineales bacterium]|nr:LysM peptidoglycan-binding domain-containing protein [Caldilineales bacterium]
MQAYSRRPLTPIPALQLPSGHLQPVNANNFVIGSGAGCNLRLKDRGVAERHLILQRAGEYWQAALISLEASAQVNKAPMNGIVRLRNGDTIKLGRTRMRFVEDGAAVGMTGLLWSRMWMFALILVAALVIMALALAANNQRQASVMPMPSETLATPMESTVVPTPEPTPPPPVISIIVPTAPAVPIPTDTPEVEAWPTVSGLLPTALPETEEEIFPGCPRPNGFQIITVAEGESLEDLAQRYGSSVTRLRRANCLDSNLVKSGDRLYVPEG